MGPLTDNQNGSVLGSTCFVRPLFVSPLVFIQHSASQANPKGTSSTNECCSQARSVAMLHNRRFTWVSSFYFTVRRLYSWRMKLLDVANFINTCMRKIFIYVSVAVLARTYSSLTPTATHPSRYHVSIQFQRWGHNPQQTKCFLRVNARFSFVLMDRAELFSESLTKESKFQRKSIVVEIGELEEGYAWYGFYVYFTYLCDQWSSYFPDDLM